MARMMGRTFAWIKWHPFWSLLFFFVAFALLSFLFFQVGGSGSGGMDTGDPFTP